MVFFLAFASALELLIGNVLLYLAIMVTISLVSGVTYSIYSFFLGEYIPSLGFSDVVTGMIGLSAYLMPRAKIKTFVWLGFWAWIIFIPAWMLATWFIGWDIWRLFTAAGESSTNFLAHVSGGIAGYFIGKLWLAERKWLIEPELESEIEHMRHARDGFLGVFSSPVNLRAVRNIKHSERLRSHHRSFDETLLHAYKLNETYQCDAALEVLVHGIKAFGESEDVLKDVFNSVVGWRHTRFTLCYARYYITYLIDRGNEKAALNICAACFEIAPDFLLDRSKDVVPLAERAEKQERYSLAHSLVRNADDRYPDAPEKITFRVLEAKYLYNYLARQDDGRAILGELIADPSLRHRADIQSLLALCGSLPPTRTLFGDTPTRAS
jgi:hypothetical protein